MFENSKKHDFAHFKLLTLIIPGGLSGGSVESFNPGYIVNKSVDTLVLVVRENFKSFVQF